MNGRKLVFNPGGNEFVLPDSEAGYADGVLWLYLQGVTMAQAFELLSDPAYTSVIVFQYGEMEDRYEGMTRLTAILADDGQVRAALKRGADAE